MVLALQKTIWQYLLRLNVGFPGGLTIKNPPVMHQRREEATAHGIVYSNEKEHAMLHCSIRHIPQV